MIVLPASLYLLLHLVGWVAPAPLWGVDMLHYYPAGVGLVVSLVCLTGILLSLQPRWSAAIESALAPALRRLPGWYAGLAAATALAWLFRVGSHHLGDSQVWFRNLRAAVEGALGPQEAWFAATPIADLHYLPALQVLDYVLHLQAFRAGQALFGWDPATAYAVLSVAACPVYAALLWRLAGFLTDVPDRRTTWFLLLLSAGTLQLFFGYAESYTLLHVALAAYAWMALRFLDGSATLREPVVTLAVAVALHSMALSLVPSLFILAWHDRGAIGAVLRRPLIYRGLGVVAAAAAAALYIGFYKDHHLPLRVVGDPGRFGVLSWEHALNLVNAALLVSPFGLVWFVGLRLPRGRPTDRFLLTAVASTTALICIHNVTMGGRDWDLMSLPGLFTLLLGLRCIEARPDAISLAHQIRWAVLPVMVLHTALWIGVNHSPDRALDRLGNLMYFSPNQPLHYRAFTRGHYNLNLRSDPISAIPHFQEALDRAPSGGDRDFRGHYRRFLEGAREQASARTRMAR